MPANPENHFWNIRLQITSLMPATSSTIKCGKKKINKQDNKENYES